MNDSRDRMEFEGVITDHAHDIFRVKIDGPKDHIVKAKLSGKMRMHKINLDIGDRVRVEVSPYDMNNGRITLRLRVVKDAGNSVNQGTPTE